MGVTAWVSAETEGQPFQMVWDAIANLQSQIDNIELLPGPQGEPGPQGPAGEPSWDEQRVVELEERIDELEAKLNEVPWDLTGTYTVYFGGNRHQMVVDSMDLVTGDFSGHGTFLDAPGYSWTMTGHLDGYSFTFRIVYTETLPGYYVDTTGTVAPDGTLSGSGVSGIGEHFIFYSSTGTATKNY